MEVHFSDLMFGKFLKLKSAGHQFKDFDELIDNEILMQFYCNYIIQRLN